MTPNDPNRVAAEQRQAIDVERAEEHRVFEFILDWAEVNEDRVSVSVERRGADPDDDGS